MNFFKKYRAMSLGAGNAVLAGTFALAATGMQAQQAPSGSGVPDAQVEANVLRQLATAPDLSTQSIQSTTVYGTVTLSGVVQTEALRTKAENLAARADGVKKVVDQLTLGDPATAAVNDPNMQGAPQDQQNQQAYNQPQGVLQSDGTYAPAQPGDNTAPPNNNQAYSQPPAYSNGAPGQAQAPGYAQAPPPGYDNTQPYNGQPGAQPYGGQPGAQPYGQPGVPPRRPMYSANNGYGYAPGQAPYPATGPAAGPGAGQAGGVPVTVPDGVMIQVRVNRGIDSNHIQPGAPFDGVVMNDVTAGGWVAIPRGTAVQGTVVDAKKAGALKGRGELALQLNTLTFGGQTYQVASVPWDREGRDKTITTVNSALGMGALGAILGGVAGGGSGAAIGAAAGGAVGVAGSASSPGGRVIVPPESILTFHLAQPTTVTTVSQQEMARLSYAAGPPQGARPMVRRYGPYGYYYAPAPGPYYGRPY